MTDEPIITKRGSMVTKVEKGKKYFWCACGKSKEQPFCDGSHAGTGILPIFYEAEKDGNVSFCGCKHSKNGALCDGSHKALD